MTNFKLDISLKQDMPEKEVSQVARDIASKMFAVFPEYNILLIGHNGGESEFAMVNPLHHRQIQAPKEEPECISA